MLLGDKRQLSEEQYKLLIETYSYHQSTLPTEYRDKLDIQKVRKSDCNLEVYYTNGEWFVYTTDRTVN